MGRVFYVLECEVSGCIAEFYLNDVPVIRRGEELGKFYKGQSNHLCRKGRNEVTILVEPGETPGTALTGSPGRRRAVRAGARAEARLVRYPRGAVAGGPDGEVLLEVAWRGRDDGRAEFFPRVVIGEVSFDAVSEPWEWEHAPPVRLDEEARASILRFLEELRLALDRGDAEPLIARSRMRLDDIASAYGNRPGVKEEQIREVTARDASAPWWGMQPLDPAAFDPRICGGGRLVECIASDWLPALREKMNEDEESMGTYSMLLCKTGAGEWHIAR